MSQTARCKNYPVITFLWFYSLKLTVTVSQKSAMGLLLSPNLSYHLEHSLSFLRSKTFLFGKPLLISIASKTKSIIPVASSRNSLFPFFWSLLPGHSHLLFFHHFRVLRSFSCLPRFVRPLNLTLILWLSPSPPFHKAHPFTAIWCPVSSQPCHLPALWLFKLTYTPCASGSSSQNCCGG